MTMLKRLRDRLVQRVVKEEVALYLAALTAGREAYRRCLTCNARFAPRRRWHFFCEKRCRDEWYAGQIRPRRRD